MLRSRGSIWTGDDWPLGVIAAPMNQSVAVCGAAAAGLAIADSRQSAPSAAVSPTRRWDCFGDFIDWSIRTAVSEGDPPRGGSYHCVLGGWPGPHAPGNTGHGSGYWREARYSA